VGASIVQGADLEEAIRNAWLLGVNPGGEVMAVEVEHMPPASYRNRLITSKAELREMGDEMSGNRRLHNGCGDLVEEENGHPDL
jgi:hypothetical protein